MSSSSSSLREALSRTPMQLPITCGEHRLDGKVADSINGIYYDAKLARETTADKYIDCNTDAGESYGWAAGDMRGIVRNYLKDTAELSKTVSQRDPEVPKECRLGPQLRTFNRAVADQISKDMSKEFSSVLPVNHRVSLFTQRVLGTQF